jgi:hypothetical protein
MPSPSAQRFWPPRQFCVAPLVVDLVQFVISEQPDGDFAKWLLTFVKGMPIQFVLADEPFRI